MIILWPHRVRQFPAWYKGGASDISLTSTQRRWSFPPSPLCFDYKIVAHLIFRAEPLHLSACISHKCVHSSVMSDSLWPDGLQPARLLYPQNSPGKILEWVALSFFRGSPRPSDQTWVFCIAGRLFTIWSTGEAHLSHVSYIKKSTSCLLLCLLLNSFCTETQRTWTSVSPDTGWVIIVKTVDSGPNHNFGQVQVPGSSPNLKCMVSISRTCENTILLGKQNFAGQGLRILRRKDYPHYPCKAPL